MHFHEDCKDSQNIGTCNICIAQVGKSDYRTSTVHSDLECVHVNKNTYDFEDT